MNSLLSVEYVKPNALHFLLILFFIVKGIWVISPKSALLAKMRTLLHYTAYTFI